MRRVILLLSIVALLIPAVSFTAPISVYKSNPIYFADENGNPLYLSGTQIFGIVRDYPHSLGTGRNTYDGDSALDWDKYLTFLQARGYNFIRLWIDVSSTSNNTSDDSSYPEIYVRTGPGTANDGKATYDLTQGFNSGFFTRLHDRIEDLQDIGVYVSVMIYENFCFKTTPGDNNWFGNPFSEDNNENSLDADTDDDGCAMEFFESPSSTLQSYQQAWAQALMNNLHDLDNWYFEPYNEQGYPSLGTYEDLIGYVKAATNYDSRLFMITPGMVTEGSGGCGSSPGSYTWSTIKGTEGFSVFGGDEYTLDTFGFTLKANNPPESGDIPIINSSVKMPIMVDIDHNSISQNGDDAVLPWKLFTRGYHYTNYDTPFDDWTLETTAYDDVRYSSGKIVSWTRQVFDLGGMYPDDGQSMGSGDCSTTGWCTANPGHDYIILQEANSPFNVYLPAGKYYYEWYRIDGHVNGSTGTITQTSDGSFTLDTAQGRPSYTNVAVWLTRITSDGTDADDQLVWSTDKYDANALAMLNYIWALRGTGKVIPGQWLGDGDADWDSATGSYYDYVEGSANSCDSAFGEMPAFVGGGVRRTPPWDDAFSTGLIVWNNGAFIAMSPHEFSDPWDSDCAWNLYDSSTSSVLFGCESGGKSDGTLTSNPTAQNLTDSTQNWEHNVYDGYYVVITDCDGCDAEGIEYEIQGNEATFLTTVVGSDFYNDDVRTGDSYKIIGCNYRTHTGCGDWAEVVLSPGTYASTDRFLNMVTTNAIDVAYWKEQADATVLTKLMGETNGEWFHYSKDRTDTATPAKFKAAFRRYVEVHRNFGKVTTVDGACDVDNYYAQGTLVDGIPTNAHETITFGGGATGIALYANESDFDDVVYFELTSGTWAQVSGTISGDPLGSNYSGCTVSTVPVQGLTNEIFAYQAVSQTGIQSSSDRSDWRVWYPGDDVVDVIGWTQYVGAFANFTFNPCTIKNYDSASWIDIADIWSQHATGLYYANLATNADYYNGRPYSVRVSATTLTETASIDECKDTNNTYYFQGGSASDSEYGNLYINYSNLSDPGANVDIMNSRGTTLGTDISRTKTLYDDLKEYSQAHHKILWLAETGHGADAYYDPDHPNDGCLANGKGKLNLKTEWLDIISSDFPEISLAMFWAGADGGWMCNTSTHENHSGFFGSSNSLELDEFIPLAATYSGSTPSNGAIDVDVTQTITLEIDQNQIYTNREHEYTYWAACADTGCVTKHWPAGDPWDASNLYSKTIPADTLPNGQTVYIVTKLGIDVNGSPVGGTPVIRSFSTEEEGGTGSGGVVGFEPAATGNLGLSSGASGDGAFGITSP